MERRGRQKIERGPAIDNVAVNVSLLRMKRGLSQQELSARLGKLGRPMLPSALSKIESHDRGVDVDDLVALAVALGVNPSRLLLPFAAWEEDVRVTPDMSVPAWAAWQWADGSNPLPTLSREDGYNTEDDREDFELHSRPKELRREQRHPLMRTMNELMWSVRRVIAHAPKVPAGTLAGARRNLQRVADVLDVIEEQADGQR